MIRGAFEGESPVEGWQWRERAPSHTLQVRSVSGVLRGNPRLQGLFDTATAQPITPWHGGDLTVAVLGAPMTDDWRWVRTQIWARPSAQVRARNLAPSVSTVPTQIQSASTRESSESWHVSWTDDCPSRGEPRQRSIRECAYNVNTGPPTPLTGQSSRRTDPESKGDGRGHDPRTRRAGRAMSFKLTGGTDLVVLLASRLDRRFLASSGMDGAVQI